jgi:hypothetical protein
MFFLLADNRRHCILQNTQYGKGNCGAESFNLYYERNDCTGIRVFLTGTGTLCLRGLSETEETFMTKRNLVKFAFYLTFVFLTYPQAQPSKLARIEIRSYFEGNLAQDTMSLVPSVAQYVLTIIGYDSYGNRIGQVFSDWSMTGSLPAFNEDSAEVAVLFFDGAKTPAEGYLLAKSVLDPSISDSVWIILNTPAGTIRKDLPFNDCFRTRFTYQKGSLGIDLSDNIFPSLKIRIYDISGRKLHESFLSRIHTDINLFSKTQGFFIAVLFSGNTMIEKRVVAPFHEFQE